MVQHYSNPKRESDPHALPDLEVFEAQVLTCCECGNEYPNDDGVGAVCPSTDDCLGVLHQKGPARDAWWWWSCFPGCMPDSDINGPFDTEEEALADACEPADDEGSGPVAVFEVDTSGHVYDRPFVLPHARGEQAMGLAPGYYRITGPFDTKEEAEKD